VTARGFDVAAEAAAQSIEDAPAWPRGIFAPVTDENPRHPAQPLSRPHSRPIRNMVRAAFCKIRATKNLGHDIELSVQHAIGDLKITAE
jgi:hypothetical protein